MTTATKPTPSTKATPDKDEAIVVNGPAVQGATPAPTKAKVKRALRVPMPTNLQDAVALKAKEANVTPSIWVRDQIATLLGITIEKTATGGGRKKYANKDERKAASKERRIKRADLVKQLLAKHLAEQAEAEKATAAKA